MNTDKISKKSVRIGAALVATLLLSFVLALLTSCQRNRQQITLYTSVDEPIARPIIDDFTKQTGIHVTLVTDTEASKSVGLAERLRAEKDHPQADVWWGNEPFHTINLADEGVLAPYDSPSAKEIAPQFKDPQHRWTGNGLRVRVIAISEHEGSNVFPVPNTPVGLSLFSNPRMTNMIVMALPTAGTTGGHVAALYYLWGDDKADAYFRALRDNNIKLVGGNSVVAEEVAKGTIFAGLTDNDDVASAAQELKDSGDHYHFIASDLPDQNSIGTLAIPTTVGLVTGSKNPTAAKKLIDFLLTKEVEQKMMDVKFVMFSARADAHNDAKFMNVDYPAVARKMAEAVRRATSILQGRD
jgi:iron(III) transport system substrate-binding protein